MRHRSVAVDPVHRQRDGDVRGCLEQREDRRIFLRRERVKPVDPNLRSPQISRFRSPLRQLDDMVLVVDVQAGQLFVEFGEQQAEVVHFILQ
ncbi:hypothetical protein D3C76_1429620 [compost metagenome]